VGSRFADRLFARAGRLVAEPSRRAHLLGDHALTVASALLELGAVALNFPGEALRAETTDSLLAVLGRRTVDALDGEPVGAALQ
jgi:hypothetical protein